MKWLSHTQTQPLVHCLQNFVLYKEISNDPSVYSALLTTTIENFRRNIPMTTLYRM